MSPITHAMMGWVVSQPLKKRSDRILVTMAGLIPDIDGIGILFGTKYYSLFHHIYGHNLLFCLLLLSFALWWGKEKIKCSLLVFLSFNLHIVGDLLGSGSEWGIAYFWPLQEKFYYFSPPFQWELASWQNLVVTTLLIAMIMVISLKRGRTIVEVVSSKVDAQVVNVFKGWFKPKI